MVALTYRRNKHTTNGWLLGGGGNQAGFCLENLADHMLLIIRWKYSQQHIHDKIIFYYKQFIHPSRLRYVFPTLCPGHGAENKA